MTELYYDGTVLVSLRCMFLCIYSKEEPGVHVERK